MNFLDDAAMNPATPKLRTAPHKTGQGFDALIFCGGERCNATLGKIFAIVECSGIAKVSRRNQLCRKPKPLPITKQPHRRSFFAVRTFLLINAYANSAMSCHWLIAGSDLLSFDVEALPETSNSVIVLISLGSDVRCDQTFVIIELHVVGATSAARVPHLDAKGSRNKNRGQPKHDRNFGSAAQKIYC